ncbi:tetratricopeptide repeat protein [Novosphingobium humi]|uniref:Tetratricopeptide repeat protein n=1 Tax=Novosphingobium humi TaxID=2282397 RepID=A0ABY7U1J7_9SPHN|nr:tetratricopeptide repeat protein [Novosphingobium humi]WCT78009.1 tetratricopeptide repeat protein [Novosphingobium humi]
MKKSALWLLAPVALMMVSAPVMAAEPSVRDVYATARAGQVDKAVTMMDEVLKAHPNSAKAHYVQAELLAKQGKTADARAQLAQAEKLAPGLPGIQPQSVAALKAQLNGGSVGNGAVTRSEAPQPAQSRGISWVGIVLIGALLFGVLAFFRRRSRQAEVYNAPYGMQGGPGYGGQGYGNQGFGGPGYGGGYPQQGGGMGSSILGGLATGAAAGAGFAAGEKIIDGMFGDHKDEQRRAVREDNSGWDSGNSNQDMGGNDFGISDDSSWDSSDDGNGGDW